MRFFVEVWYSSQRYAVYFFETSIDASSYYWKMLETNPKALVHWGNYR